MGKTSSVLLFGREHFEDTIHLNLEKEEHRRLFREQVSLKDFLKIIEIEFRKKVIPGNTLLFIDEIQNSPPLINLLRFFREDMPEVHIVAAGSLLEVKIEKEGFSFPVGRVEFAYMYPVNYFEYLSAKGEERLRGFLENISLNESIPDGIHKKALKEFYEYTMIGGMPEAVKTYVEDGNLNGLQNIYSSLFTGYCEDVYKYSSYARAKYLSFVIETAPLFAGSTVSYNKFGGSDFGSREMSRAFDTLEKTMILHQLDATKSKLMPLVPQRRRPKKIFFLDVGLVNYRMNIINEYLNLKELSGFYRGRIAEQVVAQNIISRFQDTKPELFYWAKDKSSGSAEVDFCLIHSGKILGIEVKSGKAGKLRSLFSFADEVENSLIIRLYSGMLKIEKVEYSGRSYRLVSIPFYLAPGMFSFISSE